MQTWKIEVTPSPTYPGRSMGTLFTPAGMIFTVCDDMVADEAQRYLRWALGCHLLTAVVEARKDYAFLSKMTPFSNYYKGEHGKARTALRRALKEALAAGALPEAVVAPLLRDITEKRTSDWAAFTALTNAKLVPFAAFSEVA